MAFRIPHRGETIKAYVRRHEGTLLTAGELRAFLRDKLAPFEQPKAIEFRDELPLTWLGKPLRRDLVAEEMRRLNQAAAQPTSAGPGRPAPSHSGGMRCHGPKRTGPPAPPNCFPILFPLREVP